MIVISDTTPLISLLKINHLGLLEKLYGSVIVPEAVFEELTANDSYTDEASVISKSKFIESRKISNHQALQILRTLTGLDLGESEAIILAQELRADVLLMDERKGRKVARQLGIPLSGVLGVLVDSLNAGLLSAYEVNESLDNLQEAGRRISGQLINRVRDYISNS